MSKENGLALTETICAAHVDRCGCCGEGSADYRTASPSKNLASTVIALLGLKLGKCILATIVPVSDENNALFCTAESLQLFYTNHPVVVVGIVYIVVDRC